MEKVIIIGAGPAGLTAAIELLKNGGDYDVTILEGSQAMGGISQTPSAASHARSSITATAWI